MSTGVPNKRPVRSQAAPSTKVTAKEAGKQLAQTLLDSNNVSFTLKTTDGRTARDTLASVAAGKTALVPATGSQVGVSIDMLRCLVYMSQQFPIGINCLTNGTHTSNSDHYKGRAVDIGTITGHANEVLSIGSKFGGTSSGENYATNGHIHLSFRSGPLSTDGTLVDTSGDTTGSNAAPVKGVDGGQQATATAFATFLDLPGILDTAESLALRGDKSLMNDKPLFPFVEQLCSASLRNFMSLPNGDFFAFYPDYFGGLNHRTPYWEINDVEIIDATINLSDDALATHVYVVGDIANFDGVNMIDRIQSGGVVTIFNAFMADFMNGLPPDSAKPGSKKEKEKAQKFREKHPTLSDKQVATEFLKKYGARPYYEEAPMVRSPYYEAFLAYQRFCLLWSRQFLTTFEFTFMPELFPGGIVAFPEHGIQCYIDEVVHDCDYERGFTTRANLSAPAAIRDVQGNIPEGKQFISAGMIRGFQINGG